jgi:type II secretory pathway predicted ATPase ExeA
MKPFYLPFFAFTREPFGADLRVEHILKTAEVSAVADRFDYVVRLGAVGLVTGEVGSGKSTALRWALSRLHPSEFRPVWVTASAGSILELYRQICAELEVETCSFSRATLMRTIRKHILELCRERKQQPVLIIDEASLLRVEVFSELQTVIQFEGDSKPYLPIILAGQNNLADLLVYRTSLPLASRVIARCHLQAINRNDMELYLNHHLKIAGVSHPLFADAAVTAIHQGSGGLLRRANHLARGALIAAAAEKIQQVSADHVRMAATELIYPPNPQRSFKP